MLPRSVLSSALVLGVLALAAPGLAQQAPPDVLPPAADNDGASGGGSGPASEVPEKKAPSAPMAGYAYSDKPTASSRAPRSRYRARGPVVNMPGFEQTADGGSRLFVHLSQGVPVEERAAQGSITYVLKGASPRVWNNTNALVTVHFNTPVARARLVPRGQDLLFVVDLRSAATPTWKMSESADKTSMLTIDFPKGDYLQAGGEVAATDGQPAEPRPAARGRRGGRRGPPPADPPAR
ncbi:MAG: hypothetical protein KF850_07165 [Labilithrix sp.]|nr:hypothetical protein [Labilithrix sp.]